MKTVQRPSMTAGIAAVLCTLAVLGTAVAAGAHSTEERRCVRTRHLSFDRMLKGQSAETRACLKLAAKDSLAGSLDDCFREDTKGRIAKIRFKNIDKSHQHCAEEPDFGSPDAATANATAIRSQTALMTDVFGQDADEAMFSSDDEKCLLSVYEAVDRCQRARLSAATRCIKKGLGNGSITGEAGLAACADAAGGSTARILKSCGNGKILKRVEKRCEDRGVDLVTTFPACASGDAATLAQCLDRTVGCRICLTLNGAAFLDRDCDLLDDGADNDSCLGTDRWGGHTSIESTATGRFRVEEIDGLWHFITPDGHGFFSAGVNSVTQGAYSPPIDTNPYQNNILALYGTAEVWEEVSLERLQRWNFSTVGTFGSNISRGRMAYTPLISMHTSAPEIPGWPAGQTGKRIRDFFDPGWPVAAAAQAEGIRYCAEDPFCIGVFTDNELPWGPGVFMVDTFVDAYMSLPAGAPGKLELQAFFEERYGDVASFNSAWGLSLASFGDLQDLDSLGSELACEDAALTDDRRAFMSRVAMRYFQVVHDTMRALDPGMLILGPRLTTTSVGPDIIAAAAPYVDVLSLNHYLLDAPALAIFAGNGGDRYEYYFLDNRFDDLDEIYMLSGRPMMITEYTTRVPTPDVSVLFPPFFPTFDTQEERTDAYEEYQRQILSRPFMVGTHWFQWEDQPATGRGDGENSRFGVVDIEDIPYEMLTQRMTTLNSLTSQRPLPEPDPIFFPDPGTSVASAMDIAGTRFSTSRVPREAAMPGALGTRTFSIAPVGSDRTGFYVGLLPGQNLALGATSGPLLLDAGVPDAAGHAPLTLASDAIIGVHTLLGDILCLRLTAAGSSGTISCNGGMGHDVSVQSEAGELAPPEVTLAFLGVDSGPGAATLLVTTEDTQLPPGAALTDCLTTDQYGTPRVRAFSTAITTVEKGDAELTMQGEAFDCSEWTLEDADGMLAFGRPTFDGRVPDGDLAAGLLLADRADTCP
jgi:hypothetical protein